MRPRSDPPDAGPASATADLTTHLAALAAAQPSRPAIIAPGRETMRFGELAERTRAIDAARRVDVRS